LSPRSARYFAAGKTDAPATSRYLNWNVGADPKTIDPVLNGASDGGDVINQTFEGLVREKSGVIHPGIAESWTVSPTA
jgi:oligopeptide transport system substrate-binding protein